MKNLDAVTFDLWQTLIIDNRDLGLKRAQHRINGVLEVIKNSGEQFSEEHVWESYRRCSSICESIRAQGKDVSFADQVGIFVEQIDSGLQGRLTIDAMNEMRATYANSFFYSPPVLHRDAPGVLRNLKEKGYALGLISNTGMTPGIVFRIYMGQLGIMRFFDKLIFSDEVLISKPSKEVFLLMVEALKTAPNRTVHVGDNITNDVHGAKLAGLKTIWIPDANQHGEVRNSDPDVIVRNLSDVSNAVETLELQ